MNSLLHDAFYLAFSVMLSKRGNDRSEKQKNRKKSRNGKSKGLGYGLLIVVSFRDIFIK